MEKMVFTAGIGAEAVREILIKYRFKKERQIKKFFKRN